MRAGRALPKLGPMYMQLEYVRCGKPKCRCAGTPSGTRRVRGGGLHGPYWYGYWREGPKVRKRYFGKVAPVGDQAAAEPREGPPPASAVPERFEWDGHRMTRAGALRILGLGPRFTAADRRSAYRKLAATWHPDKKKTRDATRIMAAINRASEYLERYANDN